MEPRLFKSVFTLSASVLMSQLRGVSASKLGDLPDEWKIGLSIAGVVIGGVCLVKCCMKLCFGRYNQDGDFLGYARHEGP